MDSPIFIIGPPRCGTSLISRMAGSHPSIAVPFESHFYNTFVPWLPYYGDLEKPKNRERLLRDALQTLPIRSWVPRVDRGAARELIESAGRFDVNGVFAGIMAAWCASQGKRRWGEKTPAHVFFADRILAGFPDARFVCIVRDGRDAAVSWMRAQFGPKHIHAAATQWVRFLEAARRLEVELGSSRFFRLRYEDLLQDAESTMRALCEFIGETYSAGMLNFHGAHGRYPTDPRNAVNLARPIQSGNTGKWRGCLTSRELRIFEAVAGKELEAHGYERAVPGASLTAFERLGCRYIEHPPRKAAAMATNFRGQLDGLVRVMIYIRLRSGF